MTYDLATPSRLRDGPLDLPVGVALLEGLSLVVGGLALGQTQFDFGLPLLEVNLKRDERQALFGDLAPDSVDLPTMEQQLPLPFRLVATVAGELVGGDVGADQKGLAAFDQSVRVFEIETPLTQRFDLGPEKGESRLDRLDNHVVATGPPIAGHRP